MFSRGLTLVCNESKPSYAVKLFGLVGSCRAHTKIAHHPAGILQCPCDFPVCFCSLFSWESYLSPLLLPRNYLELYQVCQHSSYHHCVFDSETRAEFLDGCHLIISPQHFLWVKQPQQLKTAHMGLVSLKPSDVCFPRLETILHQDEFE